MARSYQVTHSNSTGVWTVGSEDVKPQENQEDTSRKKESCARLMSRNLDLIRFLVIVLTPPLLLPMPLVIQNVEAWCGFVILIVAVYWTTEALPLAVTGLVPAVLFPVTGVCSSTEIAPSYMKEVVLMITAGFMVAVSIEKWNLHKRLALKILLTIGCSTPRLMFGFMATAMILSMWISNTATTTMMIPIVQEVLQQIKQHLVVQEELDHELVALEESDWNNSNRILKEKVDLEHTESEKKPDETPSGTITHEQFKNICIAMQLCLVYAAGFGGTATIIGTGPITLLKGFTDVIFSAQTMDSPITFGNWMLFSFPLSLLSCLVSWIYLQMFWFGIRYTITSLLKKKSPLEKVAEKKVKGILEDEYKELGPITWAEAAVTCHFVMLALLWMTRDLGEIGGWAKLFKKTNVGVSAPAVLTVIMLFICPSKNPFNSRSGPVSKRFVPLLDIYTLLHKTPWHITLLMGGGMALADASKISGLSDWLGQAMAGLQMIPGWLLVATLCLLLSFVTEFTSNVATTAIVLPILGEMAVNVKVNPLFLMIPGAMACTFAFMLPVANPPNAIVYAYGDITITNMARSGVWIKLISVAITTVFILTWGNVIYDHQHLPEGWNNIQNVTMSINNTQQIH